MRCWRWRASIAGVPALLATGLVAPASSLWAVPVNAASLVAPALLVFLSGCEREPEPETPDVVVERFIRAMQGVHGDAEQAAEVFSLLWSGARENLEKRAQQASAVAGRPVAPHEMIVPSRFSQEFAPKRFTYEDFGKWALVRVYGREPRQFREIRCAKEEDKWRVVLDLPPPSPIQKRRAPADAEE